MTKEYSVYMKGSAILMMVFLHLFNDLSADQSLANLIVIGDVPLVYYISRMCNPVPFFLIVSGYGLYAVMLMGKGNKPCKRASNLYLHLWLIYLLLLPLALYRKPDMYPGPLSTFIKNATSWQCSYIGEQWFFFPYLILMVSSSWIFRLFDKLNGFMVCIITFFIYAITIFSLKYYGENTLAGNMLFYNIFLSFYMLLPFSLGYLAKRYDLNKKASSSFVLLFTNITINKTLAIILSYLGKHSMNIWLIHTWFSTRLFHEFIYDKIHYPILMFVVLIMVSLIYSHIVEFLYKPFKAYVDNIRC